MRFVCLFGALCSYICRPYVCAGFFCLCEPYDVAVLVVCCCCVGIYMLWCLLLRCLLFLLLCVHNVFVVLLLVCFVLYVEYGIPLLISRCCLLSVVISCVLCFV